LEDIKKKESSKFCDEDTSYLVNTEEEEKLFCHTLKFWHSWLKKCTYVGRWRETVHRSALVLKLLTFERTGAIVAAGTTGLPEFIGGERNWDYRYTWIRDASFTLYAFLRVGFTEEAQKFMEFLINICSQSSNKEEENGPLQVMYRIDGNQCLKEENLNHLEGTEDIL